MSANQPAFPQHGFTSNPEMAARMANKGGITMRQYYKAAALSAFASGQNIEQFKYLAQHESDAVSRACASFADAMLREDERDAK